MFIVKKKVFPKVHAVFYLQVLHWKGKVDKSCIERLRGFTSPPFLVGQVMEMVMILIGKRLPSQRIEARDFGGKEEMSSRMSSSSSGTKITKKGRALSFGILMFV